MARIQRFFGELELIKNPGETADIEVKIKNAEKTIHEDLAYDFNTPNAISQLFGVISMTNERLEEIKETDARKIVTFAKSILSLLGIDIGAIEISSKVRTLVDQRQKFRKENNFTEADLIKNEIKKLGYTIDDTMRGPLVYPKEYKETIG